MLLKSWVCQFKVAAMAALMEGVRSYEGSGMFNNHMYDRVVEALLGHSAAAPEALSYLITQFLPYADVRWGSTVEARLLSFENFCYTRES